MEMDVRFLHLMNAYDEIVVTAFGIVTEVNAVLQKQQAPMVVTDVGIAIDVRFKQPLKVYGWMAEIDFGMTTEVTPVD